MLIIPCVPNGASNWTQRCAIDGRDFVLSFRWNPRAATWALDVADTDGSMIIAGRALTANAPVFLSCRDARRPSGELVVLDEQQVGDDPSFDDLGTRFQLVYFTAAELT